MSKSYDVFDLTIKRTPEELLQRYINRNGQPPSPMEVLMSLDVTSNPPLPEGLKLVVKRERVVLKDHLFMEVLNET